MKTFSYLKYWLVGCGFLLIIPTIYASDQQTIFDEKEQWWIRAKKLYKEDKAIEAIDTLQTLYQRFKNEKDIARQVAAQIVLAKFHRLRMKDYQQADDLLKIAELEGSEKLESTHLLWLDFYSEWGALMESWGVRENSNLFFQKATKYYKKTLQLAQKRKLNLAKYLKLVGRVYQREEQLERALEYYHRVLKWVNFGDEEWIKTKNNLAAVYRDLGQSEKALKMQQNVLQARLLNNDDKEIGISYHNIAETLLEMEQYESTKNAIDSFFVYYHYSNTIRLDALNTKGLIHKRLFEQNKNATSLLSAIKTYQSAMDMTDSLRIRYLAEGTDLGLAKMVNEFMENALWVTSENQQVEQALAFIEKSRSLQLLDNLRKIKANNFALPIELQNAEQVWIEKIASAEKNYEKGEEHYLDSLIYFKHEHLKLVKTLERDFPQYYQLKYDHSTLKIHAIQKELNSDEAFIEYFLGENNWFAVVVQKNDKQVFRFDHSQKLKDSIQLFTRWSAEKDSLATLPSLARYSRLGHYLYQQLIGPLFPKGPIPKNLVISPHGLVETFPFDALIKTPSKDDLWPPNFMLRDHQITLAYSATVLYHNNERKNKAKKGLLGFAPVNFDYLASLFSSDKELKTIKEVLGFGDLLLGESATKVNFLQNARNYKIVHISSHAFSSPEPRILFRKDSLLLNEIYGLQLNADMVVLSSCESALGEQLPGEGVMSLARGFSYAGAASTVTTLWSVDENATMELMNYFYSFLKEGKTKGEALRLAKLAYLDNAVSQTKTIPYFWAAPVYFGRDGGIEFGGDDWGWIWWFLGMGLIGLLGWRFFK